MFMKTIWANKVLWSGTRRGWAKSASVDQNAMMKAPKSAPIHTVGSTPTRRFRASSCCGKTRTPFLRNVRSALIVAINIPLALLFAFAMLFLRGKSANLLSIGAVDFGIIVDSSVIMVENIYRHVSSMESQELSLADRVILACREVERSLFFSTIIMVCALLPLFTMSGPEGQIFGPMADTYAFALGGSLLLSL